MTGRLTRSDVRCNGVAAPRPVRGRPAAAGPVGVLAIVAALLAAGCSRLVTSPPPPDVRFVLVLPVDNRTGSPLQAEPPPLTSLIGREPARPTITAADLLTRALRDALAERGFAARVADPGRPITAPEDAARFAAATAPDAVAMYTRLQGWEATSMSHLVYVAVALEAQLVAPDGRVVWRADLPATPIDGGTASSVTLGYPEVARRVADLVVGDLRPAVAGR